MDGEKERLYKEMNNVLLYRGQLRILFIQHGFVNYYKFYFEHTHIHYISCFLLLLPQKDSEYMYLPNGTQNLFRTC